MYRPVAADRRGRFTSMTPQIDAEIESNMDAIAVLRNRNTELEEQKSQILAAYRERKVICLDHYRSTQETTPPKRAA